MSKFESKKVGMCEESACNKAIFVEEKSRGASSCVFLFYLNIVLRYWLRQVLSVAVCILWTVDRQVLLLSLSRDFFKVSSSYLNC